MKLYKAVYVASVSSEGALVRGRMWELDLYSGGRVDVRIHDLEEVEGAFCEACAAARHISNYYSYLKRRPTYLFVVRW